VLRHGLGPCAAPQAHQAQPVRREVGADFITP
jgi:hypothetical protein